MSDKILSTNEIAARVRPIAEKYRVQAVYLFGSYARGEADETSDLDFLDASSAASILSPRSSSPSPKNCAQRWTKRSTFLRSARPTPTARFTTPL